MGKLEGREHIVVLLDRYTLGTDLYFPRSNRTDDGYASPAGLEKLVGSRCTIVDCIIPVEYCKIVIICNYLVCYTMGILHILTTSP